jgi:hypothetical protein
MLLDFVCWLESLDRFVRHKELRSPACGEDLSVLNVTFAGFLVRHENINRFAGLMLHAGTYGVAFLALSRRNGTHVIADARRPKLPVSCFLPEGLCQKVNNALGRRMSVAIVSTNSRNLTVGFHGSAKGKKLAMLCQHALCKGEKRIQKLIQVGMRHKGLLGKLAVAELESHLHAIGP